MITRSGQACVLGCDVGTQSTKGVLLTESGTIAATASQAYRVDLPGPQWAQQDAGSWLQAVATVVTSLTRGAPGPVTHIGIAAQVDGVVPVDAGLRPVHPALIWMDRRATESAEVVARRVGVDEIYAITGLNCDAGHAAPKMRWLLDRLEIRPARLLPPAGMVTAWLTGEVAQDHANASSSMLYDVCAREWSARMLDAFEIDDRLLAPVVDATTDLGPVRAAVAERLGLGAACRVVAGTGDDHAGAVGAGAVRPGVVVDITGTAEPIGTTAAAPVFDPDRLVEPHAHAVPGASFIENAGFVSGGSVLWISRILGTGQAEVLARAAAADPGAGGLLFIPALSGSMTPRWNANARGAFVGLTMDHGPDELSRAVLEGCGYAARDVVDRLAGLGLPVDEIRVTGGGGRSSTWMQIKADAIGRPVRTVDSDATAVGAACLAAVAAGWYPDLGAAADAALPATATWYQPHPSTVERYATGYRRYRQAFDALEPIYERS
jgi:xylulokinase